MIEVDTKGVATVKPIYRPNSELKRVGVDLDGTLAEAVFSPDNPTDEIGPPIWANVEKLNALILAGYRVYIYTSRPDYQVEMIEAWLEEHGIPYRDVRTGKPLYAAYVDDRAIHASEESWLP